MVGNEWGAFVKKMFQGRETMGVGVLVYREVTSTIVMVVLVGRERLILRKCWYI
jgi:hypothetical protein